MRCSEKMTVKPTPEEELAANYSPRLFRLFAWYARRQLRNQFHTIRALRGNGPVADPGQALIVYGNHASWWDPMVALFLTRYVFVDRVPRAPIDATALGRYRFFAKLGFFGIELDNRRGAVRFLRTAESSLLNPACLLWLTPQGRFSDVRERPPRFKPGLVHIASRNLPALIQPMTSEYVFWEEKQPEILLAFGEPVPCGEAFGEPKSTARNDAQASSTPGPSDRFESALAQLQDRLAAASIARDPNAFSILLRGSQGVGGVYDGWRRLRSRWRGEAFQAAHGAK